MSEIKTDDSDELMDSHDSIEAGEQSLTTFKEVLNDVNKLLKDDNKEKYNKKLVTKYYYSFESHLSPNTPLDGKIDLNKNTFLTELAQKEPDVANIVKSHFSTQIEAEQRIDTKEVLVIAVFTKIQNELDDKVYSTKEKANEINKTHKLKNQTQLPPPQNLDTNNPEIQDLKAQAIDMIFNQDGDTDAATEHFIDKIIAIQMGEAMIKQDIDDPNAFEQQLRQQLNGHEIQNYLSESFAIERKFKIVEFYKSKGLMVPSSNLDSNIDLNAIFRQLYDEEADMDAFFKELAQNTIDAYANNVKNYYNAQKESAEWKAMMASVEKSGDYDKAFKAMQNGGEEWSEFYTDHTKDFEFKPGDQSASEQIKQLKDIDRSFPPETKYTESGNEFLAANSDLEELPPVIKNVIRDDSKSEIRTSDRGILIILHEHEGTQIFIGNNGERMVLFDKHTQNPYIQSASSLEDIEQLIDMKNAADYLKSIGMDGYFTAKQQMLDFVATLSSKELKTTDSVGDSKNDAFLKADQFKQYLNEMLHKILGIDRSEEIDFSTNSQAQILDQKGLTKDGKIKPLNALDKFWAKKIDYDQGQTKENHIKEDE